MHRETTGHEFCGTASQCAGDDPVRSAPLVENAAQAALRQTALSPSLQPCVRDESPAFELKFLLDEALAPAGVSKYRHCWRTVGGAGYGTKGVATSDRTAPGGSFGNA